MLKGLIFTIIFIYNLSILILSTLKYATVFCCRKNWKLIIFILHRSPDSYIHSLGHEFFEWPNNLRRTFALFFWWWGWGIQRIVIYRLQFNLFHRRGPYYAVEAVDRKFSLNELPTDERANLLSLGSHSMVMATYRLNGGGGKILMRILGLFVVNCLSRSTYNNV